MSGSSSKKMWGGRFSKRPDPRAEAFSGSLSFDRRLAGADITGSLAHARALGRAGILSKGEERRLAAALRRLGREIARGDGDFTTGEEDIHTWVENRLRERVGDLADKLHTGRSRNDQVAQDLRLYLVEETGLMREALRALREALLDLAERAAGSVAAGHTHLQPAQPVLFAHQLLAYFEMFQRDGERLRDLLPRLAVLTLGSGALAGTTIPLDRRRLARDLGLAGISRNSIDAVSDRDFAVELAACASLIMVHLSRLSEELILWSHPAFGWIELPEEFCTGSSLMPQKRNPDMPELIRGKSGRVIGHLTGLLVTLKGLPLAYNRDLQEDKEAVFDIVDTLRPSLDVAAALVRGLTFDERRLGEAARSGFASATDLAEYLALKGVPFRQAHGIVGALVRDVLAAGRAPEELTLEELRAHSPLFDRDALALIAPAASVRAKRVPGGTGPGRVRSALKAARARNDKV